MNTPVTPERNEPEAQGRRHSNVRLGLMLGVFILAVFAVTLWKFRPL